MDAFEKWVVDYALMHEREITKADCEAAFRAGMLRAAELATNMDSVEEYCAAILAEADKP